MKAPLRTFAVAGLAMLLAGLSPDVSRADLLGVTFFGKQLIDVDPTTGTETLVGPLGSTSAPFGLATRNNQLFTFDSNADLVRQINPSTGGLIASYNIGIGPVLGQGGLAFRSDGIGFLTSALDPTTFDPVNNLYRFDISSGTSTLVGHTAVTIESLAFGLDGTLFGLGKAGAGDGGNLYTINPTTAATTLIGNVGVAVGSPIGALTFSPGGQLYATLDDKLYTLNTSTGAATAVGSTDPTIGTGFSSISGLAFTAVPEPSSVVLLAIGMGALGFFARNRKRRPRFAAVAD